MIQRAGRKLGLSDLLEASYLPRHVLSAGTIEQYRLACREFERLVGTPAWELDELSLVSYAQRLLASGTSPATVRRRAAVIRSVWKFGHRLGQVCRPVCEPPAIREPRRAPNCWDWHDELPRLVAACRAWEPSKYRGGNRETMNRGGWTGEHLAGLALVIYETGERIGALLRVPRAGLDVRRLTLLVPAELRKGRGEDRVYDLTPATVEMLVGLGREAMNRLFPFAGKVQTLRGHLKRVLIAAGLPATRRHLFHCLRRTHITAVAVSCGIDAAREAAGHSSVAVTYRYVDRSKFLRRRLCDLIPAVG